MLPMNKISPISVLICHIIMLYGLGWGAGLMRIVLIIMPRLRMRSEVYGSMFVCLSVSVSVPV